MSIVCCSTLVPPAVDASGGANSPRPEAPQTNHGQVPQPSAGPTLTRHHVTEEQLVGPRWKPFRYLKSGVQPRAYLQFHSDGTWTGSDGCNGQSGRYRLAPTGHVTATQGPQTQVGCRMVPVGSLLTKTYRVETEGQLLLLIAKNDDTLLRLRATRHRGANPTQSPTSTTGHGDSLVPADAERPAAGICGTSSGPLATVEVNPDTPAPRCLTVRPGQRLRVVNVSSRFGQSGTSVTVTFADFPPRVLRVGDATTFDRPVGDYLAPGVHNVRISLYGGGGAEVWLR